MADEKNLNQMGQDKPGDKGFEVQELSDQNLDEVAGGAFENEEFSKDPGNSCINNVAHC